MVIVVFECIQYIMYSAYYAGIQMSARVQLHSFFFVPLSVLHLMYKSVFLLLVLFFSMSNLFQLKFTRTQNANPQSYVAYLTPHDAYQDDCIVDKKRFEKKRERKKI